MVYSSHKTLWTVITLIFFRIKFQSCGTGFTYVQLFIMNWFIFWTNAIFIALVPNHVVWATFAHFVLSIVFWRTRWAIATSFFHLIVILIFIGIAVSICFISLMNGLNEGHKKEEPKYFFIHLNKIYISN